MIRTRIASGDADMLIRGSGRIYVGTSVYHDDGGGRARWWVVGDYDWAAHMPKTKPRGPGGLAMSRLNSLEACQG
jgi:hypothetical protein